ncbi:MAG TPA: DUF2336 domain-containing protein [Devosiaceae bacterium]|nr:DUF2336 domain-containing protein [Devosiaceae bacterium]
MELLRELASVTEDTKRRHLLRHVASLFLVADKEGLETTQVSVFGEVICELLKKAPLDDRIDLSSRIADSSNAPRDVIVTIARDEIAVASPVLERSPVLNEDDLIEISKNADGAHRVAVSKRADLSDRVTDELISHRETEVLRTVTANPTDRISADGYTTIAAQSGDDDELRRHLVARPDLPVEIARDVLPMLGDAERRTLRQLLEQKGELLDEMIFRARAETSEKKIEASRKRLQAKAFAADVEQGRATLDDITMRLADERRPHCLAMVLSQVNKLPESQVYQAILGASGELLALICRANGISHDGYLKANEMRRALLKLPSKGAALSRQKYDALSVGEAQRAMRFAKVVSRQTGP